MGQEIDLKDGKYQIPYKGRSSKEEEKNSYYINDNKEKITKENLNTNNNEINIDKIEEDKDKKIIPTVTVKIKIEGGFWEKEFNKETPLNQISSEFKESNNLEKIKKNHYIEFIYNNSSIQMDSRLLNEILDEDQTEIILNQEMKQIPGIEKKEIIEPVDFIGKPLDNPFEIYTLDIKQKKISKIKYSKEKERIFELNKFGINSAYCNGINHLFISGGSDSYTDEILSIFWVVDLKDKLFQVRTNMPLPKKNHRMIYIEKKVYMIGGNDESTLFYDISKNNFTEWAKLKKKKFEPSLIKFNEGKYSKDYNFEKINLIEDNPEWETVNPKISPDLLNLNFSQRFFGLIEDKNERIEGYEEINLSEKAFLPINENTYVIFPDFKRRAPKVLYFYKDRNALEINSYRSNQRLTQIANQTRIVSLGESMNGLNLNMPVVKNKNIYINEDFRTKLGKNEVNLKKGGIISNYENNIKINLNKNNNNIYDQNKFNNYFKSEKNYIQPIKINMNEIKKESSFEILGTNKNNSLIKKENNNFSTIKEENIIVNEKQNIPEVIDNVTIEKKSSVENKEENKNNNINNIEKTSDKETKSLREDEISKKIEDNKDNNTGRKIDDNNINNNIKEEPKNETKIEPEEREKELNNNIENIKNEKSVTTMEIFDYDKAYSLVTFHSSVNTAHNYAKLENNKEVKNKLKMKYLIPPKEVNPKTLKYVRRKFDNYEINGFSDNYNY